MFFVRVSSISRIVDFMFPQQSNHLRPSRWLLCSSCSLWILVFPKVPCLLPSFFFYLFIFLHRRLILCCCFAADTTLHCFVSCSVTLQATTNAKQDHDSQCIIYFQSTMNPCLRFYQPYVSILLKLLSFLFHSTISPSSPQLNFDLCFHPNKSLISGPIREFSSSLVSLRVSTYLVLCTNLISCPMPDAFFAPIHLPFLCTLGIHPTVRCVAQLRLSPSLSWSGSTKDRSIDQWFHSDLKSAVTCSLLSNYFTISSVPVNFVPVPQSSSRQFPFPWLSFS